MSTIKLAYALHYFPDYDGDKHPWHWYCGETIDELTRTSAHASEDEALEFLSNRLLTMVQKRRELAKR
jgi:hypothetical protein